MYICLGLGTCDYQSKCWIERTYVETEDVLVDDDKAFFLWNTWRAAKCNSYIETVYFKKGTLKLHWITIGKPRAGKE